MKPPTRLVLGIDGGGTKTVVWLARYGLDSDQSAVADFGGTMETIGHGRSGSSNVRSVGFETALANLDRAVDDAFDDAKILRVTVQRACVALAGSGRDTEQQRIRSWADECRLAERLVVVDDALPVLYAAADDGVGIALISGTGSLAVGRNSGGESARCGGWGGMMGDEGSGYQISVAALRAAARADDRRGPKTRLLDALLQHYQITDALDLIPIVYAKASNRASIASIAPLVFSAANSGDAVARQIIDQASSDLAEMVETLAVRLKMTDRPCMLAGTGSVLVHQPEFAQDVLGKLARSGVKLKYHEVRESVAGTLVIATR